MGRNLWEENKGRNASNVVLITVFPYKLQHFKKILQNFEEKNSITEYYQ